MAITINRPKRNQGKESGNRVVHSTPLYLSRPVHREFPRKMMKIHRKYIGAWLVLMLIFLNQGAAVAGVNQDSQFLTSLQTQVGDATSGWMTSALALAKGLFVGLAGIEIAWTGINWALKKNDLGEFLSSFVLKMMALAFFYMLLTEAPIWIPLILKSFSQAGVAIGSAGGTAPPLGTGPANLGQPIDPSTVFGEGETIVLALWKSFGHAASIWHVGDTIAGGMSAIVAMVLIFIAYGVLSLQILITNIESYIIIGGGALLLGFNATKWTQVFAEKYLGYAFSVGIKLFVLYLIVGLGERLSAQWTLDFANNDYSPAMALQIGAAAMVYGAMAVMVPGIAGSMLNGTPGMSLGNTMGAAAGAAAPMAAAGTAGLAGGMMLLDKMKSGTTGGGMPIGLPGGGVGGSTDKLAALGSLATGRGGAGALSGAAGLSAGQGPGGASSAAGASVKGASAPAANAGAGAAPEGVAAGAPGGDGNSAAANANSGAAQAGEAAAGEGATMDGKNATAGGSAETAPAGAGATRTVPPAVEAVGRAAQKMMAGKTATGASSSFTPQGSGATGGASSAGSRSHGASGSGGRQSASSSRSAGATGAASNSGTLDALGDATGRGGTPVSARTASSGDEKSLARKVAEAAARATPASAKHILDAAARHEGGGGGIQIRLGHSE